MAFGHISAELPRALRARVHGGIVHFLCSQGKNIVTQIRYWGKADVCRPEKWNSNIVTVLNTTVCRFLVFLPPRDVACHRPSTDVFVYEINSTYTYPISTCFFFLAKYNTINYKSSCCGSINRVRLCPERYTSAQQKKKKNNFPLKTV